MIHVIIMISWHQILSLAFHSYRVNSKTLALDKTPGLQSNYMESKLTHWLIDWIWGKKNPVIFSPDYIICCMRLRNKAHREINLVASTDVVLHERKELNLSLSLHGNNYLAISILKSTDNNLMVFFLYVDLVEELRSCTPYTAWSHEL